MVENFYGLRWYNQKEEYWILCMRDGYLVPSSRNKLDDYPDYKTKHHTVYWAKHTRIIPEELCVWVD